MTRNQAASHVGTSGWSYRHWKERFYPPDLAPSRWLDYYARRFTTVEINTSFYRLPGFAFAVKASRYITHGKKFKDPHDSLENFLERVDALGDRRGPVLFQLPPRWTRNAERFESFLAALPAGLSCAFEFRDPSWFHQQTYQALERHKAALCIYELAGESSPKRITADFLYVRLHGPGSAYQGSYQTAALAGWAGACSSWNRQGRNVYCYFDNDQNAYAPRNALELARMSTGGVDHPDGWHGP